MQKQVGNLEKYGKGVQKGDWNMKNKKKEGKNQAGHKDPFKGTYRSTLLQKWRQKTSWEHENPILNPSTEHIK